MAEISYGSITIIDTNDIQRFYVQYAKNNSSVNPPLTGWSQNRPVWQNGFYIWQRTVAKREGVALEATDYGNPVCITGEKGSTAQWYYGESLIHTNGTITLSISQTENVAVGAMYLNIKTGACYKCTAISGSNATWIYAGNITDGISIGGRNLLYQTGSSSYPITDNLTAYYVDFTFSNKKIKNAVTLEEGVTYTFSLDITSSVEPFQISVGTGTGAYLKDIITLTDLYNGRNSITFVPTATQLASGTTFAFRAPRYSYSTTFTYSVDAIKLEKGNKATDWTPAPEDIENEIATKADSTDAVFEEQLIYISKVSGTLNVDGITTWVTANSDIQNTWSTKRPTYDTNYPVLFIAKQKKTVSGTVTCTTPLKDDTTTIIDGGHITTGTIDASQVNVTNIDASNISTGILNANRIGANSIDVSKINVSSISIGDLNGANNYAQKTDIGWSVLINVSTIDYINDTATIYASVYKDGNIQTSGFTLQWYKTVTSTNITPEITTTTAISGATSNVLNVTDLDASYTCIVN